MKLTKVIGVRVVVVLIGLFALEKTLYHVWGYGQRIVQERHSYLGWRILPEESGYYHHPRYPENAPRVADPINEEGFRDDREWPEPSGEPHPDRFVVACLGNSMTYGTGVEVPRTWPRFLEAMLRERFEERGDEREVLVLNFGVQGYVLEQSVRNYEVNARGYRPDVTILLLHPRDVTPMRPSFDDPDYRYRDLVVGSALYDWLNRTVINDWIPPPTDPYDTSDADWEVMDRALGRDPFAPEARPRWDEAKERLLDLLRMVREDGGRLVLGQLPILSYLMHPDDPQVARRLEPWLEEEVAPEAEHSVPFVDPFPWFAAQMAPLAEEIIEKDGMTILPGHDRIIDPRLEHAKESPFQLHDTGHYTAVGHRIVAEVAFRAMEEAGLF